MRTDEHCIVSKGFDKTILDKIEDNQIVTARRYYLDPVKWEVMQAEGFVDYEKMVVKETPEYKKLASVKWISRTKERADIEVDETMTMQGSVWLMSRSWWDKVIGELQTEGYGTHYQDTTEMLFKTWKAGGKLMVNKGAWFAHKHRSFPRTHQYATEKAIPEWGTVAESGQPFLVDDIEKHEVFKGKMRDRYKTKSFVSCPIIIKNKVLGVLNMNDKNDGSPFTEDEFELIKVIANHAAIAIENAFLMNQLRTKSAELDELNKRLIDSDISRSQFLTLLSHDMRTPLNAIKGAVYYLQQTENLTRSAQREFHEIISRETVNLTTTVENLIDFLRIEDETKLLKQYTVNLNSQLRELSALKSFKKILATRNLKLTIDIPDDLTDIVGDRIRITQFFINLIEAISATSNRALSPFQPVMTSGNRAEEPIVRDEETARRALAPFADAFLDHNRGSFMRVDDSVVRRRAGRTLFLRRARGYVPATIPLRGSGPPVLGCGAEVKNTLALTTPGAAVVSQHIGDLENHETLEFFLEALANLKAVYRVEPAAIAHDLHPGYFSTRWALEQEGVERWGVQHHWAHIASVLAETGLAGPVIGVALDGSGHGPDGTVWGGEFLIADGRSFERAASFLPVPLPGGEGAFYRTHPNPSYGEGLLWEWRKGIGSWGKLTWRKK